MRISASLVAASLVVVAVGVAGPAGAASGGVAAPRMSSSRGARPSSGCATGPGTELTAVRQTVTVGGASRWYLVTTPASGSVAVPRPLVLDFHGLAEGAALHAATSQFGALAQKDGFIVAFPDGTGSPVHWDTTTRGAQNPDLAYVTAVLDQLESTLCIDTARVYADGFSDGAFMVSLLACTMSARFAAIAAVSGLQVPRPCPIRRRVPILAFHGTADPILYFNGGVGTGVLRQLLGGGPAVTTTTRPARLHGPGYPAAVAAWAVKDGCGSNARDVRVTPHVIRRTYPCPKGVGVVFYILLGGGHAWPGSAFSRSISAITGFTTFEIAATPTIWRFFTRYRLS